MSEISQEVKRCGICGRKLSAKYHANCYYCGVSAHDNCLNQDIYLYSIEHYDASICAGSGTYDEAVRGSVCDKCLAKNKGETK